MCELSLLTEKDLSPKANKALKYLRKEILLGKFSAGDHISAPEIASKLDISRVPVREAINELEKQGIVNTIPRRGSFLVKFDNDDIREIYDIRMMLEGRILEILIKERLLTTKDLNCLEKLANKMLNVAQENEITREEIIKFMEFDMNFHQLLWKRSERKLSYKILMSNYIQLQIAMILDYQQESNLEQTAENHFQIIEQLKNRDIEGCRQALRDHIFVYNDKLGEII